MSQRDLAMAMALIASTAPYGEMHDVVRDVNDAADALLDRYRPNDPAIAAKYRAERLAKRGGRDHRSDPRGLCAAANACEAKAKRLLDYQPRKLSRGLDFEGMAIELRRMAEESLNAPNEPTT